MDIIFHIGFPKCASTTLQNQVFCQEQGYLGTHKDLALKKNYAKRFKAFAPVGPRQWGNLQQARHWSIEVFNSFGPDLNRLILSDEMLTNRNKLNSRPIIGFLKKFQGIWAWGNVKVLLILRSPADRLSSSYAQNSISNQKASQHDFEQFIIKQLSPREQINYDRWVDDLFQCFGKDKVCVLLMEDITELEFWQQMNTFCQLDNFHPEVALHSMSSNTRKSAKNTWMIRPFDPQYKAKKMALDTFGLVWPHHLLPGLRPQLFSKVQNMVHGYYQRKYPSVNLYRESMIELKPELRQKIQNKYKGMTDRLSNLLYRDLSKIGY